MITVLELRGVPGFVILAALAGSVILTFALASLAACMTGGRIRSAALFLAVSAVAVNGIGQSADQSWLLWLVLPLQALSLATSVTLLVRHSRRSAKR